MKSIIKLTNEYASNLKCFFFNIDSEVAAYYTMFSSIFKDCIVSNNREIVIKEHLETVDIVFIKIDGHVKFENLQELRKFLNSLRKSNDMLPIYLIHEHITDSKVLEMIDACYCFDGSLPTPFERERVYRFLYRVLKRVITEKELNAYTKDLEYQLFEPILTLQKESKKDIEPKKSAKKVDKSRKKDIRFTQTDKISAVEFMNILDDSIIDKVENLEMELDSLLELIYRLEESSSATSIDIVQSNIRPIIDDIDILVSSMGYFAVTARAFGTLNDFLATLTIEEFENQEGKSLFITMLLAVINDLEKWLKVIFIEHTTDDIHYLDASFSSNILEIEQIFYVCNEDEDEDDLEFF